MEKTLDRERHWQRIEAGNKDLRALIRRDFSASRMNDTKWVEAISLLGGLGLKRVKWVDIEEVSQWMTIWIPGVATPEYSQYLDTSNYGPFIALSVEWLEINPIVTEHRAMLLPNTMIDNSTEIEHALQSVNVPYHWEDSYIRIVGHVRRSQIPADSSFHA